MKPHTRHVKPETRNLAVTFVIMAGGKGERLWPLSCAPVPKVCLSLNGGPSLLQETVRRLRPVWPRARWLVVTTTEQAKAVRAELPRALRSCLLVEPQTKNTAACITLAAIMLACRNPQQIMVVVPADHRIDDVQAFRRAVRAAIALAVRHDAVSMIGVRPTHAHAGLGYLCVGAALPRAHRPRAFRLARFIEKPSRTQARGLIRRRGVYWNTGIFVGTADKFLECVTQCLPDHTRRLVPLAAAFNQRDGRNGHAVAGMPRAFARRARRAYRLLEAVSFDRGVMNTTNGGVVVEGTFAWADLGSLDIWAQQSRSKARAVMIESANVTALAPARHLVAAVGVRNLIIVHTPSVTLVCRSNMTQAVREVVKRLAGDPRFSRYR